MSRNPEYNTMLQRMQELHDKKSHDYALDTNVFSNFERAGEIGSWFHDPTDKSFANLIGVKLARLAELLNGKEALNESTYDTFVDCANYMVIWGSRWVARSPRAEPPRRRHFFRRGADERCCKECGAALGSNNHFRGHLYPAGARGPCPVCGMETTHDIHFSGPNVTAEVKDE